jgi:hypothetical protein
MSFKSFAAVKITIVVTEGLEDPASSVFSVA